MAVMQLFFHEHSNLRITGGTKLEPGNGYIYHVFLSPGTLSVEKATTPVNIDYLVVGGGGGGGGQQLYPPGSYGSGGGGAGGVLDGTISGASQGNTYPIQVGGGGAGGSSGPPATYGTSGTPSYITGPEGFPPITSYGGGGGGAGMPPPQPTQSNGQPGGSGGGGGADTRPGGNGTTGQGNSGGTAILSGNLASGGGGGSGGSGSNNTLGGVAAQYPSFPGPIIAPAIPSQERPGWTPVVGPTGYYASGGNGGSNAKNLTTNGGAGPNSPLGKDAKEYTGGGGGGARGGSATSSSGGSGGTGIVIVRYSTS